MATDKILECTGMYKSFGPTKAVVNVNFSIAPGEIRGLIGENGSGKSTLCGMITGVLKMDSGEMKFLGEKYSPSSLIESKSKGVCMLQQETGTINGLTVAENIFIGKESMFAKFGIVDKRKMNMEAAKVLADIGIEVNPEIMITELSFEERKLIEVASAMYNDPKILIVDETTTALSQKGREIIYSIIDKMKKENKAVIFITHDLQELMDVCDTATVLRDGHYVDTLNVKECSEDQIRMSMIGRDLTGHYYRADNGTEISKEVVLEVSELSYGKSLRNVSFKLHKGEILGIGGLTDCGMHELGKVIFGAIKPDKGCVKVSSGTEIKDTSDALNMRVAYIPKDRDMESIFLAASIKDNITVASTQKTSKFGLISKRAEKKLANQESKKLSVKMQGINQFVKDLSGGNKQKVAIAKWLANESEIFVMDCPTRGIDIGVKAAIYSLMEQLIAEGKSIIMISEELPELIGMSDRILIFKDGKINGEFYRKDGLSESIIIKKMI